MKKLLFVCTGNTCRSPMAQAFFNTAAAADSELKELFCAASAGIYASSGQPASPHSIQTMLEDWNIDISGHRARNISSEDIQASHLVLTMTEAHKYALLEKYQNHKGKIYTLNEYVSEINFTGMVCRDITDPFSRPLEVYRKCAYEINQAVAALVKKLKIKVI